MQQPKCPIAWTIADGPYPCAFKNAMDICSYLNGWNKRCIHLERYKDAVSSILSECPQCGRPVETTKGQLGKHIHPLCRVCSDELDEFVALADHIAGRC